jgi:hypothetical protein
LRVELNAERGRSSSVKSAVAFLFVVLAMGGSLSVMGAFGAGASAVASAAVITTPGSTTPLRSGGSTTPYGVILPQGASCPGDTAHDNYHVFSYLVRKGISLASVNFGGILPSRGLGYIADGSYYGAINTVENTGRVAELPTAFTWSRLTPQELFRKGETTAVWDGGIACATERGVVTDYWNTEVAFKASPTDPGGFTWAVVGDDSPSSPTGQVSWLVIALPVTVAVLALVGFALNRRRPRKEHSVDH